MFTKNRLIEKGSKSMIMYKKSLITDNKARMTDYIRAKDSQQPLSPRLLLFSIPLLEVMCHRFQSKL